MNDACFSFAFSKQKAKRGEFQSALWGMVPWELQLLLGDGTSTLVTPGSMGGGTKQGWPWDGNSTALVSAQPRATLQPWEAGGVGGRQAAAGSNEAKGRRRDKAMSDAPHNDMGSSGPTRWDRLIPPLVPPHPPMALAHSCTGGDAGPPPPGPTLVQRSKARRQDEGHSPKDAPAASGQGTEGCPKTGCPVPRKANIPRQPACAEEVWGTAGASGGG